ncbi:MAG: penicillin acylase family protein [Deltaproteobacteria bacterium]|nr:penicillin acylase family protein [Deltaproteobacteria bacterium]
MTVRGGALLWILLAWGCSETAASPDSGVSLDGSTQGADAGDAAVDDAGGGASDVGPSDGDILIRGLTRAVRVLYDEHHAVHLRCATDEDCFAAQGYFTAADRFMQMDILRRDATGRLAALGGDVNRDIQTRTVVLVTREGEPLESAVWASAEPSTRLAFDAYARGVNAWLADYRGGRQGARIDPRYAFVDPNSIEDWRPEDSVALVLSTFFVRDSSIIEFLSGSAVTAFTATEAADLLAIRTVTGDGTLPASQVRARSLHPMTATLEEARRRLIAYRDLLRDPFVPFDSSRLFSTGSNNWVIAGTKTRVGAALLATDPHSGLSEPSLFSMMHLDAKSEGTGLFHASGLTLCGAPGVIPDFQNEELAMATTVAYYDHSDVYLETLTASGTAVLFEGNDVPLISRHFTFQTTGAPVERTVLFVPHHGPLVSADSTRGISIRSIHYDRRDIADYWIGLGYLASIEDAIDHLSRHPGMDENLVIAEKGGRVAWLPYGAIPSRPWASTYPPWLPIPGDGSAEWQGLVPLTQLPQAVDPVAGFVATSNNDMTGALADGDPSNEGRPVFQGFADPGIRHARVVELIRSGGSRHDLESIDAIQSDVYSVMGERMSPRIVAMARTRTASLTAGALALVDALDTWDYFCPTGLSGHAPDSAADTSSRAAASSIGCTAFTVFLGELTIALFDDEYAARGVNYLEAFDWRTFEQVVLPEVFIGSYWDDVSTRAVETSTDTVVRAIETSAAHLVRRLGPDPDAWRWGRIHTLSRNPFAGRGVPTPFASGGSNHTVDVAAPRRPRTRDYAYSLGPAFRFQCEAGASVQCRYQLPGGHEPIPGSPYAEDLIIPYLEHQSAPLHFTREDVDASAIQTKEAWPAP